MRLTALPTLTLVAALLLGALVSPGAASAQTVAEPTPTEAAYLAATKPYRDRVGAYQKLLAAHQQAATEGQLDSITLQELSDLTRELFAAQRAFTDARPSARLDQYDRTIKLGIDRAYAATVLLLRAQRTESQPDNEALIREAGIQAASSIKLLVEATDELRMQVPAAQ